MTLHVDMTAAASPGESALLRAVRKLLSVAFWSVTITAALLGSALILR